MANHHIQNAAHLAIAAGKPTKKEAFKLVYEALEQPESLEAPQVQALKQLYAYFMPSLPKRPKTAFQWVAKASAKKDARYYLNYVYQDADGTLVATDGHRLHIIENYGEARTWYNPNTGDETGDVGHFPDYRRVVPSADDMAFAGYIESQAQLEHRPLNDSKGNTAAILPNGSAVYALYLEDALQGFNAPCLWVQNAVDKAVVITDDATADRHATIMPVRL